MSTSSSPRMRVTHGARLADLPQLAGAPEALRRDIRVVSQVLPFKVNDYVVDELIDWSRVPDDPIYRLTFPHRDMLPATAYDEVAGLLDRGAPAAELRAAADRIRRSLDPHPGGQLERNVPVLDGRRLWGLQHKSRETVLFFPGQGQTCHAYCGYCFRWAQFVGIEELRQSSRDARLLVEYLRRHPFVTDVLLTGGDPLIMPTRHLASYLEPLLELEHVRTLRLGSKALAYWPQRFLSDPDADALLRLLERCAAAGKHVAFMAHFTHPRELETEAVARAIGRLRGAGAVIRTQSPLVRHVNDEPAAWARLWQRQVALGCVPYYLFVERETGARRYYQLPLLRALEVYQEATRACSGLGRTARGPVMSAAPGKVVLDGVAEVRGERVLCLRFLQARNPAWVGRPFFARHDPEAAWLWDLRPAGDEAEFFFARDPVQDWRDVPGEAPPRAGRRARSGALPLIHPLSSADGAEA